MIPFVRDFDFEYGRCDQVSPLIRRVMANNPGPFTFTGTATFIVGHGQVAVIDPGPALSDHFDALKRALEGERVTHVLITHTHADHAPLGRPLAEATGAELLAMRGAGAGAASVHTLDEPDLGAFEPDRWIEDGEKVSGPGWKLKAVATPGHASNHVAFALEEENALFSGDHVMGWSTTVVAPPDGDMRAYIDSLKRVMAEGYGTLWPTHGPPVRNVGPFLQACLDHRLMRERQLLDALAHGPAGIEAMVPKLYAETDPKLWPAAGLSMRAHLIKLMEEGRVFCREGLYEIA
ncbi:MAG: MBL fold metallo-hydrolase [Brevundimonas sp.]|uniref:MBL fold metallo-hydrolase n=1 Tax=Brevundimonas sp. TaxID=1871086 RepID=UPI00391A0FB9